MLKRYKPFGTSRPQREPKPDRSDEFASWTPRPRAVAVPAVPSVLALVEPIELVEVDAPSSAEALAHMGRIKAMECICCRLMNRQQQSITDVHHIREGRQPRNDWLTIPLCHEDCHQGRRGVHEDRTYLRQLQVGEFTLLAHTLAIFTKEHVR